MGIIVGYHGCSTAAAQELLSGSAFRASNKPYDWLGTGAYFWEADVLRAFEWAQNRGFDRPCVVGAVIELGHCLDLTSQTGIRAVRAMYASYLDLQSRTGEPVPRNEDSPSASSGDLVLRRLDRAVIDHLHSVYSSGSASDGGRRVAFDTVRALFPEGNPLYPNAGFRDKTHVQIAVRNPEQILGTFRVPVWQQEQLKLPSLYPF